MELIRKKIKDIEDFDNIDVNKLHEYSYVLIDEEILARIALFRRHSSAYILILEVLNDLTVNMTNGVKFQKKDAKLTYQLATEEIIWSNLSEQKKRSIARKPDLVKVIDQGNMDIVPLLAISRIIEYIRNGKITFKESYYFQDIGERIKLIELNENEGYLTPEVLDQFISGTYPINDFQSFNSTTKISAGMAFLGHGVIAGGRVHYELKRNLEEGSIKRLKQNIELLNKVGKILKDEPELGRVMAMRKHIYVDNLNVRKMVEDFGYLILKNVSQMGFPIDDICNVVERSNNLKKKTRIVEGTRTRVEPNEAELLLKSAELILCIVGLYHLLNGWNGYGSPINLADVRLIRPA